MKTKKKEIKIKIICPPIASTDIELDLVNLTEYLVKNGKAEWVGGILGGEFGYGCHFKNKVFEMRPYYWGECDCGWEEFFNENDFKEKHSKRCYQSLVDKELIKNGWKKNKWNYLEAPKKLSWDQATRIKNKIRKKYCKQFGLEFPNGSAIHCSCGRDNRWRDWFIKKVKEFRGNICKIDESNLPNPHKDTCSLVLPNFKHYKSGLEIRWYKWIGRNMGYNKQISKKEWIKIFKECIKSI